MHYATSLPALGRGYETVDGVAYPSLESKKAREVGRPLGLPSRVGPASLMANKLRNYIAATKS